MSDAQLSTRRQLELMRDLQRLARERHAEELRIAKAYDQGMVDAKQRWEKTHKPALTDYDNAVADTNDVDARQRESCSEDYERVSGALRREYQNRRDQLERKRKRVKDEAQQQLNDESWQIRSVYDAKKDQPRVRLEDVADQLVKHRKRLEEIEQAAADVLSSRLLGVKPADTEPEDASDTTFEETGKQADAKVDQTLQCIADLAASAHQTTQRVYDSRLGRMFDTSNFPVLLLALFAVAMVGAMFGVGFEPIGRSLMIGAGAGAGAVVVVGALLWLAARPIARRFAQQGNEEVAAGIARARTLALETGARSRQRCEQHARQLVETRDSELAAVKEAVTNKLKEAKAQIDAERAEIDADYPERLRVAREENDADIKRLDDELHNRLNDLARERDETVESAQRLRDETEAALLAQRDGDFSAMQQQWLTGCAAVSAEFAQMRDSCDRLFPDWSKTRFDEWEKPDEPSLAVEFGRATLNLASIKNGLSTDDRLTPPETSIDIPALITLTEHPAMFVTARGAAKQKAVDLLQAVTLRFLTGQPPGKVRLTLLDPVGLGEGLSPFMHLADYEEDLIAGRIWSESRDIDQQLLRLTNHMETVIQKYLRSEYDDIHAYNAQAGEVAEPFQVVVVSGFPNNFSDTAAKRLVSLATGGPRCGVYVLGVIDGAVKVPTDFKLDELTADAVNVNWDEERKSFVWRYPAFERLPLEVAGPPGSERMIEVIRKAGGAAKDAIKVEVPFSVVAPQDEGFWTMSCSNELLVPVGRAGANRLQNVRLGKGTSQHLLVAGKTGSGKSTFLHALITSAGLHYSPDELEFYLVDFKKGVEFKSYANNRLPHARVIAIESEREFGLSVLERLDQELTRRGELYRKSGVQNLADFRAAHPEVPMPRILLVIDEFQELFTEDDRLAQESSLMMDRLVRQGRAFGVHVILGTQTLAGAYSIARSTLGQIAIRVALECSESDAHLILADERNEAARFLSRPGEAIYNDQNGMVSANEPFQVVWLPDGERAKRLAVLDDYRQQQSVPVGEMIVFEGNAPADPQKNKKILEDGAAATGAPPVAYFGDAVAIKPPTHARFGRHAGANLLLVGPQEESALGVLSAASASLVTASPGARLVILDGSRHGDAALGVWPKLAESLGDSAQVFDPNNSAGAINDIAEEVTRREASTDATDPAIYLVVWSGARFRDLRKSDDDFSFSMSSDDKPASPDKQLADILRNGPSVGVHVLVWCDGYNQAARMFDRMTMREFALRIAFQMSAADSSNLLDSPAASNLRQHRALFYSDETGESEKFRPYGAPSDAWLESIRVGSAVRTGE